MYWREETESSPGAELRTSLGRRGEVLGTLAARDASIEARSAALLAAAAELSAVISAG